MLGAGRWEAGSPWPSSGRWGLALVAVSGVLALTGCATSVAGTAVGPVPSLAVPATERSSAPGSGPAASDEAAVPSSGHGEGTHTAGELPVPIEFSLPDGWRSVRPGEVNADGAAFVALHQASDAEFTPNITIAGEVRDTDVPLTRVADEAVDRLRERATVLDSGGRTEVDDTQHLGKTGLSQGVVLSVSRGGESLRVVQIQTFVGFTDTPEPGRRAVLQFVFSALPDDLDRLTGDFEDFLSGIEVNDS